MMLQNGNLRFDTVAGKVYLDGVEKHIKCKGRKLLRYFMEHPGQLLTTRDILKNVWGPAHVHDTQYLRVLLSELRRHIDTPGKPSFITTIPGEGYRLESAPMEQYMVSLGALVELHAAIRFVQDAAALGKDLREAATLLQSAAAKLPVAQEVT